MSLSQHVIKRFSIVLIFISFLLNAQDQKFKPMIHFGVVGSQVNGDNYSGFNKAGVAVGAGIYSKITEKFSWQFEFNYIQKGSRHNSNYDKNDFNFYLLRLQYAEVPLLLNYNYKNLWFQAGFSAGYLFKTYEENQYGVVNTFAPFRKLDYSAVAGVGLKFDKLFFIMSSANSLRSIRPWNLPAGFIPVNAYQRAFSNGNYNVLLELKLQYVFGLINNE